ncbi:hypothetical protein [Paenibacillus chungangensis]|uniref:Uncharacterized protein n=1 Tax=Paenibacillus chungangensis TaxID=696535 RepID=A0ABW3HYQ3_9BACL
MVTHMRTRYPVYEWDKDNVIRFIHMKDLIREHLTSETDIRMLIRTVTTVPETMPISTYRIRITRIGLKLSHPHGLRNPAAPNEHNEEELK